MKTKTISLALLTGLSLIIASCSNNNNENKTGETQEQNAAVPAEAEIKSINSMDFHKSMISDPLFRNENADKSFVISDLLITGYQIWDKGNLHPNGAIVLEATAYNPQSKKFLHFFDEGQKAYGATLNGEKIERETLADNYKSSDGWIDSYTIVLNDLTQVKLLKIYDPKTTSGNTHITGEATGPELDQYPDEKFEIKDLIKIKGTFKKVNSGSIRFEDAEIIN